MSSDSEISVEQIMADIRNRAMARRSGADAAPLLEAFRSSGGTAAQSRIWFNSLGRLHHEVTAASSLRNTIGVVNPRRAGLHNEVLQLFKKIMCRLLGWYTRPLQEFHRAVVASLSETVQAVERLHADTTAIRRELEDARKNLGSVENLQGDLRSIAERLESVEQELRQRTLSVEPRG